MIAFVTGGSGFVGGHLCERLRREGWTVRALVRKSSGTEVLEDAGCDLVAGSLGAPASFRGALAGADVIFHLAGITKAVRARDFARVNGGGTEAVLDAAADAGFKGRFVYLSSLAAAGPAPAPAQARTESMEPRPVSAYGRGKLLGERHVRSAPNSIETVILRPGAIYGPREHEIYQVVRTLAKTGLALRVGPDFRVQMTHVDDVVSALMHAAANPEMVGRVYNLVDQQVWRLSEVLHLLGEAIGRRIRIVPLPMALGWAAGGVIDAASLAVRRPLSPFNTDKMRELAAGDWIGDSTRLTRDCGWRAEWALPAGLHDTIRWYRAKGWLA
jgi:nucleoside-diphosphate-sugar epimerase